MKTRAILFSTLSLFVATLCWGQDVPKIMEMKPEMTEVWEPEVEVVTPGEKYGDAPSDAIILFKDGFMNEWTNDKGDLPEWPVEDGVMTVGPSQIKTKRKFGSVQLHIEWRSPSVVKGTSQGRGNSGVFFADGRYEVQVLDSYNNRTYRNGQAASVYKQHAPLVNASKKPGEWQTYDIIFMHPHFNEDGTYLVPPKITVFHNGVLVQNSVELRGPTLYIGMPEYNIEKHGPGSIMLQNHGDKVSYRNIWVRELKK
ncbi:MAG: DUF1080 domain-containing protein [Dysgonamonadaceae bacterium]|nr:DUF1080 domain-containing protein [Dysgonamonadaceae bacterium]